MQFRFIYKFLATILDLLPEIYDNNLLHLHKIFTKIFFVIDELYLWMEKSNTITMTFLTCKFLKKNSILSLFHNDPNNCCSCKIHFQLKLLYPSEKIILMGKKSEIVFGWKQSCYNKD
jgi:hypothetical protein